MASGRATVAASRSIVARNASGESSSGMMSLNRMPRFGKSGTSRMWSSSRIIRGARRARSMDDLAALVVQVREVDRAPELGQRARFDLPHPLARDAEMLAGLLERPRDAVVEAVADAQDLLLALGQRAKQPVDLLVLELELDQALHRHRWPADVLGGKLFE